MKKTNFINHAQKMQKLKINTEEIPIKKKEKDRAARET